MNSIKEYVYNFVEGKVTVLEFISMCEKHPEILEWVQNVAPSTLRGAEIIPDNTAPGGLRVVPAPYDIYRSLGRIMQNRESSGELVFQMNYLGEIATVMRFAFPNSPPQKDMTLMNLYSLMLKCCPSYIGGTEVARSGIVEQIVRSIPDNISSTTGIKWARERIKEKFHIQGSHYPHWIQEPEWPVLNGEPMEYVKTQKCAGGQIHVFRDSKTGTERLIEDYF